MSRICFIALLMLLQGAAFAQYGIVRPTVERDAGTRDPFAADDAVEAIQDDEGVQQLDRRHPLGLLPNPVHRTDTRFTHDDLIWRNPDSLLLGFHEYDPASKWRYPFHTLGNVGQNHRALVFHEWRAPGYRPAFNACRNYWRTPSKVRYYNTKVPYTSLDYVIGEGSENDAQVVHTQNFGPFFNAAMDYRLLNRKGDFIRQKTLMHNLDLNNWYNSPNHRYTMMAALLFNKLANQENGGVDFDNLYASENAGLNKRAVPVHLPDAMNRVRNLGLHIKHLFFLGPERSVAISDSSSMDVVQRKAAVSFAMTYDHWTHRYMDSESDSGFYTSFYIDSAMTSDTLRYSTIRHEVRWENTPEQHQGDSLVLSRARRFVSIAHEHTWYDNMAIRDSWHNLALSAGINTNLLVERKWHFGAVAEVHVGPRAAGDHMVDAFARWQPNRSWSLQLAARSQRSSAGRKEESYFSNHYSWERELSPVLHYGISLDLDLRDRLADVEFAWHRMRHYIYFDQQSMPAQLDDALDVLVFRAGKAFDWKHFYFYNGITAQYVSRSKALRLPEFLFRQRLQYHGGFVKGRLNAHLGLDITYHTNYRADAYNPAIMEFYLQDEEVLKFYPVVDVFFEILIKQARLFFLLQHANQGMFDQKGYFTAPGYGSQERAFKFGVSWKFYD